MIFRSAAFSRRAGMDEAAFAEHWRHVHGTLASRMPGVHRYLQNHIRERLFEVAPFPDHPVDAISQQWFDDIAAMERCERSEEYAAVKRDIPNFQGAITILVLAGQPLIDAPLPGGAAKLVVLSQWKKDGGSAADAMPALEAAATAGAAPLRCVQNMVVDRAHPVSANVPQGKVPIDGMAELWFEDGAALRAWVNSPAGRAFVHGQELLKPLAVYAVDEVRIV